MRFLPQTISNGVDFGTFGHQKFGQNFFRRPSFSTARLTICANAMSIHALLPQGRWQTSDLIGGQHG